MNTNPGGDRYTGHRFQCKKCQKKYKYDISGKDRYPCKKGGLHELIEIFQDTQTEEPESDPVAAKDRMDDLAENEEILKNLRKKSKKLPETKDKPISKQAFISLFGNPWKFLNGKLEGVVDDADLKWLAEIWEFDKEEREALLDAIYETLKEAAPQVLIWLAGEGYLNYIGIAITIIAALAPRIVKTAKGYKEYRSIKKGDLIEDRGKDPDNN